MVKKKGVVIPEFPGSVKTLEFKLDLNKDQVETFERWLKGCRILWNLGLSYWEEEQQRYYRTQYPVDSYHDRDVWKIYPNSNPKDTAAASLPVKERRGLYCSLPTDDEGNLRFCSYRPHFGCDDPRKQATDVAYTKHTPEPYIKSLGEIPATFKESVVKTLADSWQEYLKGKKRRPRHKKFKNKVVTLKSNHGGKFGILGDRIKIINLGFVRAKGLDKRWTNNVHRTSPIRTVQITKKASGWYLQLSGYFLVPNEPPSKPDTAIALDPGVSALLTSDSGEKFENPRYYLAAQKELRRLQKKLARQEKERKKRPDQRVSNRALMTKQKIAKLHEKIARQRKAHHHQISTHLVDVYGAIAIEENSLRNMTRRPRPIKKSQGEGYEHNGAAAKSGLNKSLLDAGTGMLRDMIKSKATSRGREFHLVSAHYNSQTCPKCGDVWKKPKETYHVHDCQACGFKADRDQAAAMIVRAKAPWTREYKAESPISTQPQQALPQGQQVQAPVDSQGQPAIALQLVLPLV